MTVIVVFFVVHWFLAAFVQVFFMHRYAAHGQFSMSKRWERFFYVLTYLVLGSSFLPPRAYAILHRQHHAYSDTERDPHSPQNYRTIFGMMLATRRNFDDIANARVAVEPRFDGRCPEWPALDKLGWWAPGQVAWACAYSLVYILFAPTPWLWLLIPVHILMALVHGMMVNWCGHRYGYRNFDTRDGSTNALPIDFLVLGDMMQNNHHKHPMRPSTAVRWFEIDAAGLVIRALFALGIIHAHAPPRDSERRAREARNEAPPA
jgi:stearoyl-CoA desaturase (Delta-9 desaturase)